MSPNRLKVNPKIGVVILSAGAFAFVYAYVGFGWLGFIAGAIVGEGPGISQEHALRNERVFGVVGGLWAACLVVWGLVRYFKRRNGKHVQPKD